MSKRKEPSSSSQSDKDKKVKSSSEPTYTKEERVSIDRFKNLLRFKTVTLEAPKTGANREAVAFLKGILDTIGLKTKVYEYLEGRPVLVASLLSKSDKAESLSSILLNSHYDVVPAFPEKWITDPFTPIEQDGKIYGRGTQDMKSVCIQYIEAIQKLVQSKKHESFQRHVHLSFMPDEEYSGAGMKAWATSAEFKALRVGFALDEGIANPGDEYTVFYGERAVNWLMIKATGETGHGSRFVKNTAMGKLIRSVNHFLAYRDEQEKVLYGDGENGCSHAQAKKLGDVTTLNLTVLKGGVESEDGKYAINVVPMEAQAGFDIRLPPHVDWKELEKKIKEWTKEDGMSYDFIIKTDNNPTTSTERKKNPFWGVLEDALQKKTKISPEIFPAATDGRFLRCEGVPVIGFSPIKNTPVLLHDHNEYLPTQVFLEGILVYVDLIQALATFDGK